ncbi:MAG: hypothetical protein M3Z31_11910 [Pseudomonadota bacterium]|nr:hypothetical protein [Pseudomonadota bacterium]
MAESVERRETSVANFTGPLYLFLFPVPVVCFIGAMITDIAYAKSEFLMWLHFSEWLIAAGLAFGALAALVLIIEYIARPVMRDRFGWGHLALFFAALIVELFNALVHSVDGWTAVVPTGMTLSVIGAILAYLAAGALMFMPVAWVEHRRIRT